MTPRKTITLAALFVILVFAGCSGGNKKTPVSTEPSITGYPDIIPLTEGNLRGHKILYDEGWFVVSSSKKALAYAKTRAFKPSGENMRRIANSVVERSKDLGDEMGDNAEDAYKLAKNTIKTGTFLTAVGAAATANLVEDEFDYSKDTFAEACSVFVQGHISLVKRPPEDIKRLRDLPGRYFENLSQDFSNIYDIYSSVNHTVSDKIGLSWEKSFDEAAASFRAEYEQSGKRSNSLTALGDILTGYLKAFYQGVARPSAKTIVQGSGKGANSALFLPGAATAVVTGRTLEATGLALFYSAKTGYHVIAPTLESGLLTGVSMLAMASIPATVAAGTGLCAVNQVAFTAAAPVAGAGSAVARTAVDTGKYVALVGYDMTSHSTGVVINYAKSGVVLGYNALTAIPVHLILGTMDAAVFLAYDGPRLVIAAARGELKRDNGEKGYSMGALPTGAVVDLEKLKNEKGVTVEILTDDSAVINRVMDNMAKDMGGQHE